MVGTIIWLLNRTNRPPLPLASARSCDATYWKSVGLCGSRSIARSLFEPSPTLTYAIVSLALVAMPNGSAVKKPPGSGTVARTASVATSKIDTVPSVELATSPIGEPPGIRECDLLGEEPDCDLADHRIIVGIDPHDGDVVEGLRIHERRGARERNMPDCPFGPQARPKGFPVFWP